ARHRAPQHPGGQERALAVRALRGRGGGRRRRRADGASRSARRTGAGVQRSGTDQGDMRAMRILIVDDSAMMRALIKRVIGLTQLPVDEVVEAANGAEALRILESREVDLLLTDVNMPGMTGVELLREISRLRKWPDLVRVIISTDGSASRRDEAAEL